MLGRVALVITDGLEESSASIFWVTKIDQLGKTLVVSSSPIPVPLTMEDLSSFKTSVLTRATLRNIPSDAILYSRCRENLKSYKSHAVSTGRILEITFRLVCGSIP
jgi:hypothetical protein